MVNNNMIYNLSFCVWNVGGLISKNHNKLSDPLFLQEIKSHDVILLTETHVGYNTSINIDGYHYYPVCRQQSTNSRYYGGLGILIKSNIRKGIKILKNNSKDYQWLKLERSFFNLNTDIYLCLAYIIPVTSFYIEQSEDDILENIEKDIITFSQQGSIILCGDFNARTGSEPDFIQNDVLDIHLPMFDNYSCDVIQENRYSYDTKIDKRVLKSMEKLEGFDFWRHSLKSAKFVVAPMVDQSELAWRMLSRKYGAELCYTPMFHASIFARDASYRADNFQPCTEDRPLIVQFCGNDPDILLQAALLVQDDCDAVDINLGCPQMIAKRGHYGAFLQDEWDLIQKMVQICHKGLKVPITCKVRVFESIPKTVLYAQMLEKAGCQLLTVHGRTREQKGRVTGIASWEHIKAVKESVKIPVFANGNIQYLSDVHRCIEYTGVDGVMTAEGNLHNPALFHGIDPPVYQMAEEYLQLVDKYPCPLSYIRGHLFKMFQHALQVHLDIRELIGGAHSIESLKKAVLMIKQRCLEDMKKYKESKEDFVSDLPLPYWLCQPYVRPTPEQAEENLAKKQPTKRQIDMLNPPPEFAGLSKNKIKKKMRNPYKNFDKVQGREVFEKCVACSNPRGMRCEYELCRSCCKKKMWTETLDCKGHGILIKTRKQDKKEIEAKEQELNRLELNTQNGISNNVSTECDSCEKSDSGERSKSDLQLKENLTVNTSDSDKVQKNRSNQNLVSNHDGS